VNAADEGGGERVRRAETVDGENGRIGSNSGSASVGAERGSGHKISEHASSGAAVRADKDAEDLLNAAADKWGEVEAEARRRLEVEVETLQHELELLHAERASWEETALQQQMQSALAELLEKRQMLDLEVFPVTRAFLPAAVCSPAAVVVVSRPSSASCQSRANASLSIQAPVTLPPPPVPRIRLPGRQMANRWRSWKGSAKCCRRMRTEK